MVKIIKTIRKENLSDALINLQLGEGINILGYSENAVRGAVSTYNKALSKNMSVITNPKNDKIQVVWSE